MVICKFILKWPYYTLHFIYHDALDFVGLRYKGTYCSQEVAIKILKAERLNAELQKEFAQEVYIMRFVKL